VPIIAQSVRGFVRYVAPGRDEAMLLPFRNPKASPLLDRWSGNPIELFTILNAYGWTDQSSNAEGGVLGAATALDGRGGARAIVLITDAATSGEELREKSFDALAAARARVFAFAIPSGGNAWYAQTECNLMMDYASVSGGSSHAGTPIALDRPSRGLVARAHDRIVAAASLPGGHPPLRAAGRARNLDLAHRRNPRRLGQHTKIGGHRRIESRGSVRVVDRSARQHAVRAVSSPPKCLIRVLTALVSGSARRAVVTRSAPEWGQDADRRSPAVAHDLAGAQGEKVILLITDGEETCGGDPRAEIEALKAQGLDVTLNIVGFAVEDAALKDTFAAWSRAAGGVYFDAEKSEEHANAYETALAAPFDALTPDGAVAAAGIASGPPVDLPPGRYAVVVRTDPEQRFEITIESGATATVTLATP
jgi:hypothetical protein